MRTGSVGVVVDGGDRGVVLALLAEEVLLGGLRGRVWAESRGLLSVVGGSTDSTSGEFTGRQLEDGQVELGQRVEVVEGEDWLGDQIEDTVGDHLRVWRDDVATVGNTPDDGVDEPDNREEDGGRGEGSLVSWAKGGGRSSSWADENPPDVEQSGATKGEETPFVGRLDEGTDKTGDNHDKVEEDEGDNVREWETGGENKGEEQSWGGDDPVDVSSVPDLPVDASWETLRSPLGGNVGEAEVGSHGEVGNGSSGQNDL